ncbi:MAG: glucosamine-6-phosphate deaminase [Bdellovibrionota bacterium]
MDVIIVDDNIVGCNLGAKIISNFIKRKNDAVLGLATGKTPIPLYEELARLHKEEGLDFSNVKTFNLDEYYQVPPTNKGSYHYYMNHHLFSKVNIKQENTNIPNGMAEDVVKECTEYEEKIKKLGGVDIQILGIGRDAHIGFNEPSCSLASRTRLEALMEDTREANTSDFGALDLVPYYAITMGIATIMEAKEIVLLAFGESKQDAVLGCVEGSISAMCPASILQMHPHVKIIADKVAAKKLSKIDFYNAKSKKIIF